jgi:hypothetical protein
MRARWPGGVGWVKERNPAAMLMFIDAGLRFANPAYLAAASSNETFAAIC